MSIYSRNRTAISRALESGEMHEIVPLLMKWHFSESSGSTFWLRKRKELDFDPIKDVQDFRDLAHFPDVSSELRRTKVEDLVPRGLQGELPPRVFESGGTTGDPKFVVAFDSWIEELVRWRVSSYIDRLDRPVGNTLAAVPTGPHIVGAINNERARRLGGMCFNIDLDPRWAKIVSAKANSLSSSEYRAHLASQVEAIVLSQDIRFLVTTPPILEVILSRPRLVDRLRSTLAHITVGGTELSIDTIRYAKLEILPATEFSASYGSTSALGESHSNLLSADSASVTYKSFAPYITYDVVDASGVTVAPGVRGRVVVSHTSLYAFYPNVYERDTAVLRGTLDSGFGALIGDIKPISVVEGASVIEGVY